MYVIFPADELIYMTYGAALPRIKPRPTLDNLREPLVPIRSPSTSNARNESHAAHSHPVPSPRKNSNSSRTSVQFQSNITNNNNNNNETDVFGYKSSHIDSRTRSPSIVVEPPTPGSPSSIATPSTPGSLSHHPLQQQSSVDKAKPAAKPKHRLHLRLGHLGRSKQNQKPEPARLRDVTEIHIANPAFTRENLVQRNYDAFFESGEPVYSLEQRAPPQPEPEPEPPPESDHHRPRSLGFFHKSPKTKFRSKSAEIVDSVEVPQKGDRCPS